MSESVSIPDGAWILIADGEGAELYSAAVDGSSVSLTTMSDLDPENLVDGGPSGQRPPEQTDQQQDEAIFAKQVAHALYLKAHSGKFDNLVVVADPQTLGQLRGIFHQEVNDRIVTEIHKTFTNHPQDKLEDALGKMLAG